MPTEKDVDERVWCPGPWPWEWFDTCIERKHKWCYKFSWLKGTGYLFVIHYEGCENGTLYTWNGPGLGIADMGTVPDVELCFDSPHSSEGNCDSSNTGLKASGLTAEQQQSDWRFCRNCYTMFYDGYDDKGVCAKDTMKIIVVNKVSELLEQGTNLVAISYSADQLHIRVFDENGSRIFDKDEVDFVQRDNSSLNDFKKQLEHIDRKSISREQTISLLDKIGVVSGYPPTKLIKGHIAQGYDFLLPHDIPGSEWSQVEWRYCKKCHVMFFDGYSNKGPCPAGGTHQASGFNFSLPHGIAETAENQKQWRYCKKCHSMFYNGFSKKGICPAGGNHQAQGYNFVLPHL